METGNRSVLAIRGNTLRVYLFLLRHNPCELKDVQRALNLSTRSLTFYHLAKLVRIGLVNRTGEGRYTVARDISGDLLEGYVKFGNRIIPQLFFFTIIFTGILVYYAFLVTTIHVDMGDVVAIVYSSSIIVLWCETIKIWHRLPS